MSQCQYPGCTENAKSARCKYCEPHRESAAREAIERKNAQVREELAARRKAHPVLCRVEGCTNPVEKPRDHRCPSCKAARQAAEKHGKRVVDPVSPTVKDCPAQPKPEPRIAFEPIMTDAEQRKIDKAVAERINQRCGYGHGEVKRFSKAEIAKIADQVTPIHLVPARLDIGYMDRMRTEVCN